jgi:predicted dehydrogenase
MSDATVLPAHVPTTSETPVLLCDDEVITFIIRGYLILEPVFPAGFNEAIHAATSELFARVKGRLNLDDIPQVQQVWTHPLVRGALISLLGSDYRMNVHRRCHVSRPGMPSQFWHQDDINQRHHQVRTILAFYYPQDVTPELGPTVVLPGTHFRNAPTDRLATYANLRDQVLLTVKAGTVVLAHYDIWHAGTRNEGSKPRFGFRFRSIGLASPRPRVGITIPSWPRDRAVACSRRLQAHVLRLMASKRSFCATRCGIISTVQRFAVRRRPLISTCERWCEGKAGGRRMGRIGRSTIGPARDPAPRVRVGLIGCGGAGMSHAALLLAMPDVDMTALVDPVEAAIAQARQSHPLLRTVPGFTHHQDMLAAARVDAAVIATPHSLHLEQTRDCLAAGVHVLVEKPFVPDPVDAWQLVELAEARGTVLSVGYHRHGLRHFRYMREAIAAGRIGRVQFVHGHVSQNWLRATRGTWRQDPVLSCGGMLNDTGAHLLDIVTWLLEEPARDVMAQLDTLGTPVDINSAVIIRYAGGARANLTVIGHTPGRSEEITVYGEKGYLSCNLAGRVYEHLQDGDGILDVRHLPAEMELDRNFVDAILGTTEPVSTGRQAARVVEITAAIWQSAVSGRAVQVAARVPTAVQASASTLG